MEDELQPLPEEQPDRKRTKLIVLLIIVIVVLLAGGCVAAWLLTRKKAAATLAPQVITTTPQVAPDDAAKDAGTTKYVSPATALNLAFSYPSNWTVDPPTGTTGASDTVITVTSPRFSLSDAANKTVTGKIIVRIRPRIAGISELSSGVSAAAAQDSLQFAYSSPTSAQHQYPYLTFIHFADDSKVEGAFEEVAITGVNQFKKNATLSVTSVGNVSPLVTASFVQCATTECTGNDATPLGIINATWLQDPAFVQTMAVFSSLQLN